ncbi:uncharacterized protein [Procambarus clarkii]|nr:uncharacterized protein LOC123761642 [Procambarus clarkii]XP_045603661.1 uncharacterized protein LOC123761642 [Procambarus clarkii]XP_045603662.1 uncharacterized protein LOC123761642 [Procambarus clarkii]XP_045603663.1 uncharacterized protein LOC123761642 [Procambarus clarkii]XP_045603664.1 uncharacterized protein LOC123761642 [Procambarus clarkii]
MSRILRTFLQNLYGTPGVFRAQLHHKLYRTEYNIAKNCSQINRLAYTPSSIRCYSSSSTYETTKRINNKFDKDRVKHDGNHALTSVLPDNDFVEENLENLLPSQRQKHYSDILLTKIYECQTADEVFDIYKQHREVMNVRHLLTTMRQLNDLVFQGVEDGAVLHEMEDFRDLCHEIYGSARRMEADELIEVLKYLCRLEVSPESKLIQCILQMLKHFINDLEVKQLMFLDFLLKKMPLTALSDALLTAIPILIENCLKPEMLVDYSLSELSHLLSICSRGLVRNIGIILQEIYKRGSITKLSSAMTIIWNLTEMQTRKGTKSLLTKEDILAREVIMKECLEAVAKDISSLNNQQMETTLTKVYDAYEKRDVCCYNEHFLHAVSKYAVQKQLDFVKVAHLIRKLMRMNYHSEELANYMVELVLSHPQDVPEARVSVMPLLSIMSTCDAPPSGCSDALDILMEHKSMRLNTDDFFKKPLLLIVQDLFNLGYCHEGLVNIITNPDTLRIYLSKYSKEDVNHRRLLEVDMALDKLFNSHERVPKTFVDNGKRLVLNQLPSRSDLKFILHQVLDEPEHLISGVVTDSGIYIDHLLVLDEERHPVLLNLPEVKFERNISTSFLEIPEGFTRIAVLDIGSSHVYKPSDRLSGPARLKEKLLESEGYTVLNLLQPVIFRHHAEERFLYVKRELMNAGIAFR